MGAVANTVDSCGGIVHSVIPKALVKYTGKLLQEENCIITKGMHDRKQLFHDLCDAFIALPGGLGTLEELTETATWAQLGVHNKPFGVLNIKGFFEPLRDMFKKQISEGFLDLQWEDGGLIFKPDAESMLQEVLKLIVNNKVSASSIAAEEWVI
jgi:uncharacterized protein (TIGR00730 family)